MYNKDTKGFFWLCCLLVICILAIGIAIYMGYHKDKEVQGTSQTIAETQQGVKIVANKSGYRLDDGQAKEISTTIREIRTTEKEPVYIVQTTGEKAQKDSEQAKQDNKADFAIVTDRNDPDKVVNLEKLEKDQKVELNQYNIQAYKPILRTVSITPDIQDKGIKQVNFSISKKITKDGQYIGVGTGYDFQDHRVLVNLSYTW